VENKTEIMQHVFKMQLISMLSKYTHTHTHARARAHACDSVFLGMFVIHVFVYVNIGHIKVNCSMSTCQIK
jgi:hypothetical protein